MKSLEIAKRMETYAQTDDYEVTARLLTMGALEIRYLESSISLLRRQVAQLKTGAPWDHPSWDLVDDIAVAIESLYDPPEVKNLPITS